MSRRRLAIAALAMAFLVPACGEDPGAELSPRDPRLPATPPLGAGAMVPVQVYPQRDLEDVRPQVWERAEPVHARQIRVIFWSRPDTCFGVDRVEVEETRLQLILTLYTGRVPDGEDCDGEFRLHAVNVHLHRPIANRDLVDGTAVA